MEYDELVHDFAKRTRRNLEEVTLAEQNGKRVFPVTQLVNSLLGLLVFPRQKFLNSIPEMPIEALKADGWPIPRIVGDFKQVANLRELIANLRHAVCHFNVDFTYAAGEIQEFSFGIRRSRVALTGK